MQYRTLGKTGMKVSVIGYGAIKLAGVDQGTATATINRELDLGVNFIDTARAYGDSERKVGIATQGRREEFYLATKTGSRTTEAAKADLMKSLSELQMDRIDLWQLHTVSDRALYEQVMGPGGALETAKWAKEEGIVDHIGITIHREVSVMKDAIESGEFETIMLAHSVIDPENVEAEILPLAKKHNLGVIIMKPLCGGDMTMPRPQGVPKAGPDPIVRSNLRYIISNDAVTLAIPGIRTLAEVEEDCAVADSTEPLTQEQKDELLRMVGELGISFRYGQRCLRCGYCQPCPNEIDIPRVFMAMDQYQEYPDDLKYLGLEIYDSLEVKPDVCAECGECMEKCPTDMDIPARLKEARKMLEEAMESG